MDCQSLQKAFEDGLGAARDRLAAELGAIADDAERKAKVIERDFQADNDLAAGIGAAAGTVIGGVVGNAPGAAVGAVVGRQIGALFTLEIEMRRQTVSLHVPQVTMSTKRISYDLPSVTVSDRDIIFHIPTLEMRRMKGPSIPHTKIEWKIKCVGGGWVPKVCTKVPQTTLWWEDTWLDVPVTVMKEQRIVLGVPEVTMVRQDMSFDYPEVAMRQTEFSFDVPSISLRFIKDAGRRTAAQAAALAQSAQEASARKRMEFREYMRAEVAPLAQQMFGCFRNSVMEERSRAQAAFQPQISTLSASLAAMVAKGVTDDSAEFKATRAALEDATRRQAEALKTFDDALAELDEAASKAMAEFLSDADKADLVSAGDDSEQTSVSVLVSFRPAA